MTPEAFGALNNALCLCVPRGGASGVVVGLLLQVLDLVPSGLDGLPGFCEGFVCRALSNFSFEDLLACTGEHAVAVLEAAEKSAAATPA
jgi:hypothetical protein